MKIAILGTRGIPNNYGGFEQFAEYISVGLVARGHNVTVYSPHFHAYQTPDFRGVKIRHIFSPEKQIGAAANFIYDFLCLKDALSQNFDIIYEAGYHSNAPSYYLLDKDSPIVITNMDGLEWKRSKWNPITRKLIKALERLAVKKSNYLISDNEGIQEYYKSAFNADSYYIAYGADPVSEYQASALKKYGVKEFEYLLLIARLEPENNIETILDGHVLSGAAYPFLVIGNKETKYARYLTKKYMNTTIQFIGGVYNKEDLDSLRKYSLAYFHGHSVGGTNPSLLEAMASESFIVAHNNIFNRSVLTSNALYFSSPKDVSSIIRQLNSQNKDERKVFVDNNKTLIAEKYSWAHIIDLHEDLFNKLLLNRSK